MVEDLIEEELQGRTPKWVTVFTGHLYDVRDREVIFTAGEPNPFRYASAIAAYAPEHQKKKLLECMQELQRLHVLQSPKVEEVKHQYWLDRTTREDRERRLAAQRGEPSKPKEALRSDFSKSVEMEAWQRWLRARALVSTSPIIGDLAAGTLVAFGERDHAGAPLEWIARSAWRHLDPDWTTSGRFVGGGNVFWNVRVIRRADVLAMQSRPSEQPSAKLALDASRRRTGVAGRPSSKDLALAEMARRADRGELADDLIVEARQLCEWLRQTHPDAPQPKPKSLSDALRDPYRRLRGKPKTSGRPKT